VRGTIFKSGAILPNGVAPQRLLVKKVLQEVVEILERRLTAFLKQGGRYY